MQKCSTCNYQSPEGAKFCRQCGAPLYAENELTSAGTRNYGRQESAPALSAPLPARPPSVVDAFGSETARYYQAPAAAPGAGTSNLPNVGIPNAGPHVGPSFYPAASAYVPPAGYAAPREAKRRWRKALKWTGATFMLFIAVGIGAGINQESNRNRVNLSPEDRARLERLRAEDRLNRNATGAIVEFNSLIKEEIERRMEDIERAKEDARRAAERGLPVLAEKPLNLNEYEYPDATSSQYSRIPGKELLTLRTKDDFDTIVAHYQTKLGKPYAITNDRNNRRALFQTASTPSITVLVQETNDRNREKVSILRSPFPFPKPVSELASAPGETGRPVVLIDGKPFVKVDTGPAAKPAAPTLPAPVKPAQAPENR
jgi:hypothetical protein